MTFRAIIEDPQSYNNNANKQDAVEDGNGAHNNETSVNS